jgi:hypothetical protein
MTFFAPGYVAVRCDLTFDGVQATAADMVLHEIWADSAARGHIERRLRLAVAEMIVKKLAPPVFEVRADTLRAEQPIDRAEALRLAQVYTNALAELSTRLEAAGENYAVTDARRAAGAGQSLVEKLESHQGRLPARPGEERAP